MSPVREIKFTVEFTTGAVAVGANEDPQKFMDKARKALLVELKNSLFKAHIIKESSTEI